MNIASLLNQIDTGEIVLPAIQRDFVWSEPKIQKLMDSIMRSYPIGIILMWETYTDIQYRKFESNYKSKFHPHFYENDENKRLKIVLDGQQRLQSLYLAIYGCYEGKYLYFDVMSGIEADDFKEDKYLFYFMSKKEADTFNRGHINEVKQHVKNGTSDLIEREELEYFIKVSNLFNMDGKERHKIRRDIIKYYDLDDDEESRLETNISGINDSLAKEQNIVQSLVIDENKAHKSLERQTESDVLEIFVRINRQGTPLSRSDLIFSMLKLHWKDSATALPELVDDINKGNSFELDVDFIIRCLFVVSDLGAKFDVDLLRIKSNVTKITNNYDRCAKAIKATLDYVQQYCWISSSKVLGGNQNLIPFVYYLFHLQKQILPNKEVDSFRKSLFLFAFTGPFSRWGDSRISSFIKRDLKPRIEQGDLRFPYNIVISKVAYWENVINWESNVLNKNPKLALNLLQGGAGNIALSVINQREMDHIFPSSILKEKTVEDRKINNFANYWLLSKGKNINKTNKHPKEYFKDVSDTELKRAFIERDYLNYNRFNTFLKKRGEKIFNSITKKVGFKQSDWVQDSD